MPTKATFQRSKPSPQPNHRRRQLPTFQPRMKWGATGRFHEQTQNEHGWPRQQVGGIECPRNHIERSDGPKRCGTLGPQWHPPPRGKVGQGKQTPSPKNSVELGTCTPTRQPRQPQSPNIQSRPRMAEHQNNNNINHDRRPDTGFPHATTNPNDKTTPTTLMDLCHLF